MISPRGRKKNPSPVGVPTATGGRMSRGRKIRPLAAFLGIKAVLIPKNALALTGVFFVVL